MKSGAGEQGFSAVCGIDEAGRGPLAGPVCAAAVILPPDCDIPGLNDSKKLSEKKREALFPVIQEKALAFGIGWATAEEIDRVNILQATFLAMARAVEALPTPADYALVDGNRNAAPAHPRGDHREGGRHQRQHRRGLHSGQGEPGPAAAPADEEHPEYGFAKHKGYGTKAHYEAIRKYGLLPEHRRGFLKNLEAK